MHYSYLLLPFIAATNAIPTLPPQLSQDLAPLVIEQIKLLSTAVTGLTTAVNSFDGSLVGVLPQGLGVVAAEKAVDGLVLTTTFTAQESKNFTVSSSTQVVQSLAGQVGPIQESLTALKSKCGEFKKTLTAPIVLVDLKTLKNHTSGLITAIKGKVTPSDAGLLDFGKGILDQAFDSAIAAYSS